MAKPYRGCGGMVDATDLKSVDRKVVWVQVPSPPLENHFERIKANTTNYLDALPLINILQDEIQYRLNVYISCLSKATRNYFNYLLESYNEKLHTKLKGALPFSEE